MDKKDYDVPGYGKKKYSGTEYKPARGPYRDEEIEVNQPKTPKIDYEPKRVREEIVISSRLVPSVGNDSIKSLKLVSSEVVGGIFDRVKFLETRITELRSNITTRKQIHENILKEIEKDIDDRENFMQVVSDINEKRNIKLDISVLRKERRNESVQFWRDLVELDTELKTLEEQFEVEKKISSIFEGIDRIK